MKKQKTKEQNQNFRIVSQFGTVNYPVGDFIIRVKNAVLAGQHQVEAKSTKLILAVALALKSEGFLEEVNEKGGKLTVRIAYKRKEPVILNLQLVSRPGLRVYMGADKLEKIKGPSIFIVSTPKGVMSSRQALKKRLGGEIITEVL